MAYFGKLYTVIETDILTHQAVDLTGGRWDEIKEFLDKYVARNPRVGEPVPGTPYYALTIQCNPPLTLYYTIDDAEETITLEEIARIKGNQ